MKIYSYFNTFLTILLIALALSLKPIGINAQGASKSVTIIPPRFELFANPGDRVSERIRVRNDSDFPSSYSVVVEDFSSAGEEGQVVLEEETGVTSYNLAKWVELSARDVVLQPGEETTFTYNINVPRDAEPGGHYASILFQSGGEPVPGGAAVSQRIGSLILLRVSGNVVEDAAIETFEAPSYSQKGPIIFTARVKNNGNVHIQPKGTIIITNLFGQKVEEVPLVGANVLPNAVRKIETSWEKENLIGHYTATLVSTYGQQNLPLTAATRFTVISTTALVLLAIGTIAIIVFILSLISGRSKLLKAFKVLTSED